MLQLMQKKIFFDEAIKLYNNKNYEDSKFLLQRNIVFNPKDHLSYLYLAKIYKEEKNDKELKKNLDTTLLLNPKNEEAIFLLTLLKIKKSDYKESETLIKTFKKICKNLCEKEKELSKTLQGLQTK